MMPAKVETIAADNNLCGEGPIWDAQRQRLIWNDCSSSLVYQFTPSSGVKAIINHNLMVAGIALNNDGRLVFAGATGLHLWEGQDRFRTIVTEHDGETLCFNDMIAGPRGRIYVGTLYWGANGMEKHGKLYRIEPDATVHSVDEGIELSNGLGFSPDDRTLYYADSSTRRIYAYEVDAVSGDLANRRVFVQVPVTEGIPDGLTVDRDGFVWSAQWYGGQVVRYDPDGKVERRIALPVKQVSSVAFGGKDLDELYITTAGESWPSTLAPLGYDFHVPNIGGSLYRVRPGVQGRIEHRAAFP